MPGSLFVVCLAVYCVVCLAVYCTILEKLMQHAPAIVPRADLEFHLWGDEPPGSDALRTHIATLRAAIDPPDLPPLLLTHRGVGYQLLSSRRSAA